jgi:hypothetical protein
VFVIWGLSFPGVLTGIASTAFHFWMIGNKIGVYGSQPRLALTFDIWLIVLVNLASWTALVATICLVALWVWSDVPRNAGLAGLIAVASAWAGILLLFLWHDVRL